VNLTPTINQLKEQIKQLEKIVSDLEYKQLLNKALEKAKKQQNGNNNSGTKRND